MYSEGVLFLLTTKGIGRAPSSYSLIVKHRAAVKPNEVGYIIKLEPQTMGKEGREGCEPFCCNMFSENRKLAQGRLLKGQMMHYFYY
jgi:hypothetical protein